MATTSTQTMPNGDFRAKELDEVNIHQQSLQWRYGVTTELKGSEPPLNYQNGSNLITYSQIPDSNNERDGAILPIIYVPICQAIGNSSPLTTLPFGIASSWNFKRAYVYSGNSAHAPFKNAWWFSYYNESKGVEGSSFKYKTFGTNVIGAPDTRESLQAITKNNLNGDFYPFLEYASGSNLTAYVGPRAQATVSEIPFAPLNATLASNAGSGTYYTAADVFTTNGGVKKYPTSFSTFRLLPFNIYFCGYYTNHFVPDGRTNAFYLFAMQNDSAGQSCFPWQQRAHFTARVPYPTMYIHQAKCAMVDQGLPTEKYVMYFKIGTSTGTPTLFTEYEVHFYRDQNYFDVHYISFPSTITYISYGSYVSDSNGPLPPSTVITPQSITGFYPGESRALRVTTTVNGQKAYSLPYDLGKIIDTRKSTNILANTYTYQLEISNPNKYTFVSSQFGTNTVLYAITMHKNAGLASRTTKNEFQVTGEFDEVNYDWSSKPGITKVETPEGKLYVSGQLDDVTLNT